MRARATAEERRARLKRLLEAIKERGGIKIHEARKVLGNSVSVRMVRNYLADLRALGLIEYDDEQKIYTLPRKRIFANKYDYELALKHSIQIIKELGEWYVVPSERIPLSVESDASDDCLLRAIETKNEPPLRCHLFDILDKLILYPKRCNEFIQHLKTGYPEIWQSLNKFKEAYEKCEKEYQKKKEHELKEFKGFPPIMKIREHAEKLLGKLIFIVKDVEHGIPLKGECDHCPHNKVTIKES